MKDYMVRASAAGNFIRAFAVTSKGVTEAARAAHNLSPVCSAALGRTMAAGLSWAVPKEIADLSTASQHFCRLPRSSMPTNRMLCAPQ